MFIRTKCDICDSKDLKNFFTIPNMPSRFGVKQKEDEIINYYDMTYSICNNCLNVQIYSIPDLKEVYAVAHNNEIIGKKWKQHYDEFSSFILSNINDESEIFEIGDPNAKISSLIIDHDKIKEWNIIEPNIQFNEIPKLKFINGFFDKNFETSKTYDCVVMSHVFEHLYNYSDIIPAINRILKNNGMVIISVPDLKYLYDTDAMSPLGLHFEHTIYLDKNIIIFLMSKFGFELTDYKEYNNHSVFYCFQKTEKFNKEKFIIDLHLESKVLNIFESKINKINYINNYLSSNNYDAAFIYGAHIQTIMFGRLGLDLNLFFGALDNDKSKHHKVLYGTNLEAFPLEILNRFKNPIVVCDMGAYNDEIIKQIENNYSHTKII